MITLPEAHGVLNQFNIHILRFYPLLFFCQFPSIDHMHAQKVLTASASEAKKKPNGSCIVQASPKIFRH